MTVGRGDGAEPSVMVVVATFREADNIKELLTQVLETDPGLRVIVVDDDGGDGTADIACALGDKMGRIDVIRRANKSGLASAYRDGFRCALDGGADIVVGMDADLSHDPQAIPALLAAIGAGADVAVGSRYIAGGETVGWALSRRFLSRLGNWYASRILGLAATDLTSAFRAYRADALRRIDLAHLRAGGYGFLMELLYMLDCAGVRRTDVPIRFVDRQHGRSKMSTGIAIESLIVVTRLGLRRRLRGGR